MKPINIDDNLHQLLKVQSAITGENMYQIMNRYTQLGMWYDSLDDGVKADIDKEVNQFLIDKENE